MERGDGTVDIKRAKQEVENAVEAYLLKDEQGEYRIPEIRQRPVLLMGPPGIGKTQIMEQIAKELKVGLVAYTITHHTRQSAVGLPFIKEREYGGKTYSVTEYTMSEIIASVYEKIEKTGIKEGILFLDEINCVSETLAPTMLQFLQCKTFGNQKIPAGWVIVAAGNPPEYNKSVREFDVVTLDRLKKIDIEANFSVWKEYAYRQGLHPAVISYLELRKENFYRIENTVDGKYFVTARGWEDLSQLIQVYELLGKTVDREVVAQYLQHRIVAKDFANYLELYYKYKKDYNVEDILEGQWDKNTLRKIGAASFDEHLSIISPLNGKLGEMFRNTFRMDAYVTKLYEYLVYFREHQEDISLEDVEKSVENDLECGKRSETLTKEEEQIFQKVSVTFRQFLIKLAEKNQDNIDNQKNEFEKVRELFGGETEKLDVQTEHTAQMLENVFRFMEDAFGDSQEMVAFITELNANYYSLWFIRENGSDLYYRYNKGLLFDQRQQEIEHQMDDVETLAAAMGGIS